MEFAQDETTLTREEMLRIAVTGEHPFALFIVNENGGMTCLANVEETEKISQHVIFSAFEMLTMEQKIGVTNMLESKLNVVKN